MPISKVCLGSNTSASSLRRIPMLRPRPEPRPRLEIIFPPTPIPRPRRTLKLLPTDVNELGNGEIEKTRSIP